MSAVEEIQAAIAYLSEMKERATTGPWFLTYESSTHPRIWGNAGDDEADHVATTARSAKDAHLIVTLHRTIDAQLDWLRDQVARMRAEVSTIVSPEVHYRHALALARAINGGT